DLVPDLPFVRWPEPGETFLGFNLIRELGRGGFARVFLATAPALGHRFAVLKVSPHGAAEAETLGPLDHPNIVTVHSFHEDPATGLTGVCMAYQGSSTLGDVLDRVIADGIPTSARVILEVAREGALETEPLPASRKPPALLWRKGSYAQGVLSVGVH